MAKESTWSPNGAVWKRIAATAVIAFLGTLAYEGQRIHATIDEMKKDLRAHGETLAAMEVAIEGIQEDVKEIKADGMDH